MLFTQAYYTEVSLIVWHIISKFLIWYVCVNRELISSRQYYQFKCMFSDLCLKLVLHCVVILVPWRVCI